MTFLVQFEINLHSWIFNPFSPYGLVKFWYFLKNSLVQINSKLHSKSYDYLYK